MQSTEIDVQQFVKYLESLAEHAIREKKRTFHMPDQKYWQGKAEAYSLAAHKLKSGLWNSN